MFQLEVGTPFCHLPQGIQKSLLLTCLFRAYIFTMSKQHQRLAPFWEEGGFSGVKRGQCDVKRAFSSPQPINMRMTLETPFFLRMRLAVPIAMSAMKTSRRRNPEQKNGIDQVQCFSKWGLWNPYRDFVDKALMRCFHIEWAVVYLV